MSGNLKKCNVWSKEPDYIMGIKQFKNREFRRVENRQNENDEWN